MAVIIHFFKCAIINQQVTKGKVPCPHEGRLERVPINEVFQNIDQSLSFKFVGLF